MLLNTVRTEIVLFICLMLLDQAATDEDSLSSQGHASSSPRPPSAWPGHLKPLGSESVRLPVSVLDAFPTPADFFRSYVYPSVPVVIRRGAERSPAYRLWSDAYLRGLPGAQQLIAVEMRKVEDRQLSSMEMPFAEFLDRYQSHDEYLVTGVPDFLKRDVLIPPPLHCTNITTNLVDAILWFSGGGTKSHMHTDYVDNINCVFRGQKDFLFLNYTQYRHKIVFDHPEGFYSSVDVERVDYDKFPGLIGVEFLEAKLQAGDCIYVPFKWIHQVNSHGSNVAVNIWWNHQAYVVPSPESCGHPDAGLSLADVNFYFHLQTNADRRFQLHPELDFIKNPSGVLMEFMDEEQVTSLTLEQFLEFLTTMLPLLEHDAVTEEALAIGHKIFGLLDIDGDGGITSLDIDRFPTHVTQFETFYVDLGQQLMILSDVIDGQITKQKQEILEKLREDTRLVEGVTEHHSGEGIDASTQSPVAKDEL